MSTTVVEVHAAPGRARVTLRAGTIVPRLVARGPASARVALVAGGALLLGGDAIDVRVVVGAGCTLELEDIGGTVAYDGEGVRASWDATVTVGDDGTLVWHGLPFVVADGADVDRRTTVDLERRARVLVRETVVLGRTGERGGVLRMHTDVRASGRPVLVEAIELAGDAPVPGVLGRARVLDAVLALGDLPDADAVVPELAAALGTPLPRHVAVLRPEAGGLVVRAIGDDAHRADLAPVAAVLAAHVRGTHDRAVHGPVTSTPSTPEVPTHALP